jgi:phage minor structural protein
MLDQIKVLSSAEAVVCVLSNTLPDACPIIDFVIDQEAIDGGAYSDMCTLKIPANHTDVQYITQGNYLLFQDNDGNWQEYKIVQTMRHDSDASSTIEALGEHAFYELLGEPLDDIRPTTTTASLAVTQAITGTRWELGTGADLGSHSCRIYKTSVLSGLQTIAEAWGGELFFKLEVTGSVITARKVDVLATRGNVTGKRFEFHKDLVDVVQTINMQNLATALIGRGKGVEVDGGTETEDPAYGRRLEFTDVVWTIAGGDPADKPADQNWIGDDTAKAAYGPGGTRHIYAYKTFDDCTDAEELLQLTYDELQTRKAPETTYEMEAITLEEISGLEHEAVRFGDTVYVIDDAVTPIITGTARVFRIKRNYVDPTDCKVILGNYIPSSTSNIANILKYQKGMLDRSGTWDRANAITA